MGQIWRWRRGVQILVIAATLFFPVLARYGHYLSARQLDKVTEKWKGTSAGVLIKISDYTMRLGLSDGEGGVKARRPRKAILKRTRDFNGSPWSATLFGISVTDLLATAESAAASRKLRWVLVTSALIPLLATLLLGRVYCGWICPMGIIAPMARKFREVLKFLEIKPLSLEINRRDKYYLLVLGLLYGSAFGLPILHLIYPPAILGREVHGGISAFFDGAEVGKFTLFTQGLTSASLFILAVLALEILLLPGFWCKSLCPGGAVYSLLSRFRLLRIRRIKDACTDCTLCDVRCPMGLEPMTDKTGVECDNCGVCIDSCPTDALVYGWTLSEKPLQGRGVRKSKKGRSVTAAAFALMLFSGPVFAHHIMGIPHYAYDANYPQAPVIKLIEEVDDWEVQLTGYPGRPTPGVRTEVHVYVLNKKTGEPRLEPMTLEAFKIEAFGAKQSIYGPAQGRPDDNIHKYYPTYPSNGNYELLLSVDGKGEEAAALYFTLSVGEPPSPWKFLGFFGGGLLLFIIVIRAVRIKMNRRKKSAALA